MTKTIDQIIAEVRAENPYPLDIYVGKTNEGKYGRFCHKVWENCLDKVEEKLKEEEEDEE